MFALHFDAPYGEHSDSGCFGYFASFEEAENFAIAHWDVYAEGGPDWPFDQAWIEQYDPIPGVKRCVIFKPGGELITYYIHEVQV